jgi:hypothetical protein
MNANSDPAPEPIERLDKDHGDEVPPSAGLDALPSGTKSGDKKDKSSLF